MTCVLHDRGPTATHYGFHWRDGWYFRRDEEGRVHVCYHPVDVRTPPVAGAVIPGAEWESIVASVSRSAAPRKKKAKAKTAKARHA